MSAPSRGRAVLAASALSLVLNTVGSTWGLPARWHPDEKADGIARMARGEGLRPDSFVNPSLPLYVQLPFVWLQAKAVEQGLVAGVWGDALLLARVLSALAGAVAVFVLGTLSLRLSPRSWPWAAFFLALSPGFVNLCHFATPEAWLFLGTASTLLLAVLHVEDRAPAWLLGFVLGLAVSTKYTAAALAVPALAAVLLRRRAPAERGDRVLLLAAAVLSFAVGVLSSTNTGSELAASLRLEDARLLHPSSAIAFIRGLGHAVLGAGAVLAGLAVCDVWPRTRPWATTLARGEIVVLAVAAAAGFLAGTPFAAIDPVAFLSDLAYNAQTRSEYKGLVGAGSSYLPYALLLSDALTWPLLTAVVAGVLAATTRTRDRLAPILLLGAAAPYLLVASGGHRAMRFLAPVLPAAAWLGARGIEALIRHPRSRGLAHGLIVTRLALASLLVVRLFFVDSRVLAERWIEGHVLRGSTIDVIANHPGYAPRIPEGWTLRVVPTLSREMAPVERFHEAAARYPEDASPWLLLTASFYERFLENAAQQPERARFFSDLLEGRGGFEVVARFRQRGFLRPAVEFVDPEIVILRKRSTADTALQ